MVRVIEIGTVLNGWIVKVGCQRVVFTTRANLLQVLNDYLDDPTKVEKTFLERAINAHLFQAECPDRTSERGPLLQDEPSS